MRVTERYEFGPVTGIRMGNGLVGKPWLYVYVYFVDGLLIDSGQPNARKQLLAETKNLPLDQVFITHHHEDHNGNIDALRDQHSCPVYAPSLCCEMMKAPPSTSLIQKLTWGVRGPSLSLTPCDNEILTKNHRFRIIPIPGHAADMVALYEPNEGWLFSADLYINSYIGYYLKGESIAEQIKSIKKVLKLDFDALFCSHNPKPENGKKYLSEKLEFLESFYSGVAALHKNGLSGKEIMKVLELKENRLLNLLSMGKLSKLNMVNSVIDAEQGSSPG